MKISKFLFTFPVIVLYFYCKVIVSPLTKRRVKMEHAIKARPKLPTERRIERYETLGRLVRGHLSTVKVILSMNIHSTHKLLNLAYGASLYFGKVLKLDVSVRSMDIANRFRSMAMKELGNEAKSKEIDERALELYRDAIKLSIAK